ncbi:MAG: beta-ketoacyl-[acyl-carrier-protein] synthase II, partial [Bacteroidota bacterium]
GIACVMALRDGIVPPTINTTSIEPEFAEMFNFPLGRSVRKDMTYAMSNTFGFGGHIASVIFKRFDS